MDELPREELQAVIAQLTMRAAQSKKRVAEKGHLDSYNLVQRLVVRLLKDPALLVDPAFQTELEAVDLELDRQHSLGRHDSWFLADVILVKFLRGKPAEEIFSALESKEADPSFYESTDQVVGALLGRIVFVTESAREAPAAHPTVLAEDRYVRPSPRRWKRVATEKLGRTRRTWCITMPI